MENKLAQNFTITSLLKFTAPTCIMLVFMSLYQMTDAVFVSNFVGENALSALNIVFPIPSIIIAIASCWQLEEVPLLRKTWERENLEKQNKTSQ